VIRSVTDELRRELSIRGSLDLTVERLSGGNQQKVVLGRWILANSRILILDEPTHGVDVGAKAEVYRLIHQLAADGAAILLVSSELPELMNVAHRIIVLSAGRIEAELMIDQFDEKEILKAAFRAHLSHRGN
jgi:ABC-type sugar transport system ATPase subunit